jgi:hypothetical protein
MGTYAKQIVYRYNGDPKSDEVVQDADGVLPTHFMGEFVMRNGKLWKVVNVNDELTVAGPRAIPIHWVFLTDTY